MRKDGRCSRCKINKANSSGYCLSCNKENSKKWYYSNKIKFPGVINLEDEKWVFVKGAKKFYSVSNMGRLKRNRGWVKRWGNRKMFVQEKLMKLGKDGSGYYFTSMSVEGRKIHAPIAILVARHFIPNPKNKPEVNHLFGKEDNRATSLNWATKKENMEHAVANGLSASGERHGRAILTNQQVCEIFISSLSERKIASIYKVSRSTINCIKSGRSWKKITEQYKALL